MITDRHDQIIKIVYTFDKISAEQITRILGMNTVKYVRDHYLKDLCGLIKDSNLYGLDYLFRFSRPTSELGIRPYIYRLGEQGIRYLREQHFQHLPKRFVPSIARAESASPTLQHRLDINEFMIAALELTRAYPVKLIDFRHEYELRHTPLKTEENGTTFWVTPDGFLIFESHNGKDPIWLELDEGSEKNHEAFKEKIRRILFTFTSDQYEELFHTHGGIIVFATTSGIDRLENMRKLTYEELKRLDKLSESPSFLFTKIENFDPRTLFLSPIWLTCTDNNPVSLLDFS